MRRCGAQKQALEVLAVVGLTLGILLHVFFGQVVVPVPDAELGVEQRLSLVDQFQGVLALPFVIEQELGGGGGIDWRRAV